VFPISPAVNRVSVIAQMSRTIPSCSESWGSAMHADDTNYTIIKNGVP